MKTHYAHVLEWNISNVTHLFMKNCTLQSILAVCWTCEPFQVKIMACFLLVLHGTLKRNIYTLGYTHSMTMQWKHGIRHWVQNTLMCIKNQIANLLAVKIDFRVLWHTANEISERGKVSSGHHWICLKFRFLLKLYKEERTLIL